MRLQNLLDWLRGGRCLPVLLPLVTVGIPALAGSIGEVGDPQTWGADTRVVQADRFFIAGQPDQAALEMAGEQGVSVVINLRGPTESDFDESTAAESLGFDYYQVHLDGSAAELSPEALNRVSEIVESNPEANILVHCGSGNRASAWLAVYLSEYQGFSEQAAVEVAAQTGLTNKGLEDKVREYLED